MTNPITPEVRATIERLRANNYWRSDPINGQYWDGDDQDAARVVDVLLSLLPPGMPEPWIITRDMRDVEKPTAYRGLFIPLERVEPCAKEPTT